MATQFTLYGHKASPYAEKVELALKEGNIPYKYFFVNLPDKPAFFAEKVNPAGKVPAITFGGPDVVPEEPSPLSFKLAESNVILEFIADTYPEAKLIPTDPAERAKVRFFIDAVTSKYLPAFLAWILDREPQATENLLKEIEFLQRLLPDEGQYAVGNRYTIADACITPFIHRLQLSIENDIGKFPVGHGPLFGESLKDPKYAKFMAYANAAAGRPVSKETYVAENVKGTWITVFGRARTSVPLSRKLFSWVASVIQGAR